MLNEAAILAAREGRKAIEMDDLEESATKVKLGPEKKRLQSEEERRITAYHEAGHALVSSSLPHMDPVHRVSIVSRGLALGFTEVPPTTDRYHQTKTDLLERITALLGGRAAEEIKFKELTIGAANDIEKATLIARKMVAEFGMSRLGPIFLERGEKAWLARQMGEPYGYSEEMAAKIDSEVSRITGECFQRAKEILRDNSKKLDRIADALMEKETLEAEEFEKLIKKPSR
jgi:cell division protease FtsH